MFEDKPNIRYYYTTILCIYIYIYSVYYMIYLQDLSASFICSYDRYFGSHIRWSKIIYFFNIETARLIPNIYISNLQMGTQNNLKHFFKNLEMGK